MKNTYLIPYTALFIALFTALSYISIPFFPVPFTLQTLAVLLASAVMKRYAVYPAILYLLLGILGLPVFHNGMAGIGILCGPTGGYLVGFIPAACIVGICYEQTKFIIRVFGLIAGVILILLCGTGWLVISSGMEIWTAFLVGFAPFIPGDLIKALLCFVIVQRLEDAGVTLSGRLS